MRKILRSNVLTKCDSSGVPFIVQSFKRDYFCGVVQATFSVRLFNDDSDVMTINRNDAGISNGEADTELGREIVFKKLNDYVQSIYNGKIGGWK